MTLGTASGAVDTFVLRSLEVGSKGLEAGSWKLKVGF